MTIVEWILVGLAAVAILGCWVYVVVQQRRGNKLP